MSSIFTRPDPPPPPPPPPAPEKPVPLPDLNSAAAQAARNRQMTETTSQAGRMSTILTGPRRKTTRGSGGGDYGATRL